MSLWINERFLILFIIFKDWACTCIMMIPSMQDLEDHPQQELMPYLVSSKQSTAVHPWQQNSNLMLWRLHIVVGRHGQPQKLRWSKIIWRRIRRKLNFTFFTTTVLLIYWALISLIFTVLFPPPSQRTPNRMPMRMCSFVLKMTEEDSLVLHG